MQANKIIHVFQPRVPQLEFEANRFRGSLLTLGHTNKQIEILLLKGVFAKNERGYRLNAIKKRF